jgi:hypothetical protein
MRSFCTIAAIGLNLIALAGSAYSQPYSGLGPARGTGGTIPVRGPGPEWGDAARSSREAGVMVSA